MPCARAKVLEAVEIVPASMRDPQIIRIGLRCLAEFPRLAVVLQRSTVKFGLRINLFLQGDLAVNPTPRANCHTALSHGTKWSLVYSRRLAQLVVRHRASRVRGEARRAVPYTSSGSTHVCEARRAVYHIHRMGVPPISVLGLHFRIGWAESELGMTNTTGGVALRNDGTSKLPV